MPTAAPISTDYSCSTPRSDQELIRRARAGDRSAFGELYRRHRCGARTVATCNPCPGATADDLVSEAFLRLYRRVLAGGGPDSNFRAYLHNAVRRIAADRRRDDRRIDLCAKPSDQTQTPVESAEQTALDKIGRENIRDQLQVLPERSRRVLWLLYADGQPHCEVAADLGISATALTSLSLRARRRFKILTGHRLAAA